MNKYSFDLLIESKNDVKSCAAYVPYQTSRNKNMAIPKILKIN